MNLCFAINENDICNKQFPKLQRDLTMQTEDVVLCFKYLSFYKVFFLS